MAYERVSKRSSGNSHIHKKDSRWTTPAMPVQAKPVSASPQEQELPSYTPLPANWATNNNLMRSLSGAGVVQRQEESGKEELEPIQAKLTIGQPGDQYEQEADQTAQRVVNQINAPVSKQSSQGETLQREEMPEEEELQMKPASGTLQREEMPEEEELQMKPASGTLQREEMPENEDEELQMKPASSTLQREEMPEDEELQMQRKSDSEPMAATPDLESSIQQAKGGGQSLSDNIREPMEQAFGADFSGVKVHTDAQSDQMNQSIQAKAFTTGQDVFFRQGAYDPGSRGGQELLAHELTHVVQQNTQNAKIQRVEQGKGKEEAAEWVKKNPRPEGLTPYNRKQKRAKQPSDSEQDITSTNLGRTEGTNEFLKTLQNPETLKAYQELEQLTGKDILKQAGIWFVGKGTFGTVFPYKKSGSSDSDPATHVIKKENLGERDYDERKAERKRAIYIPLVAHELGFTHMPLSTSMPQESQIDNNRQNKQNNVLSNLAPGKDGSKKMREIAESFPDFQEINTAFENFVKEKTGKSIANISEEKQNQLKKEFGFNQKASEAYEKFTSEKTQELDVDEQQIQDVVILDMLFQYQDGSYTQYMFNQGNLQKIDNDDYGIGKVDRNNTGVYSSSFPVGLPNANKLLTEDTKKRILEMDGEHLKKVLKAATYKDKSDNKPKDKQKQQVFDEAKALRNLEDIQFLIREAEQYGGISLREVFDLYNARDQDEVLDPESSQATKDKYKSKIRQQTRQDSDEKVAPSQLYNILGVDSPTNRPDLFTNYINVHEILGERDKERQEELKKEREKQGDAPSIMDNPEFIEAIKKRSTQLRPERQKIVQERQQIVREQQQAKNLKVLQKLINELPSKFESLEKIEVDELLKSAQEIKDTEQIEGSNHRFSQLKNWKARRIKGKVREQIATPMATNGSNVSDKLLNEAEKEISVINHERIRSKAMYPVQVARFKQLIINNEFTLERRTNFLNKYLDTIVNSIDAIDSVPLEKLKAFGKILLEVTAKLEADIYALNKLIEQIEKIVNNVLEHKEYAKVFGKTNVFEEGIANLKNVIESYKKVAERSSEF
ncbi:DUF4157 domain-containing protein [Coleofasciculus sp. FACHB-712]|uniref:eCIS core domain-containing protein n=1 Tax=Coleofasciculus sp. FACHB-712 TaxID=2692789 RepID=UPI0018EF7670|nr:DUF4157 domain-containing protein [Coleofasciculus sp. FACHB-712]